MPETSPTSLIHARGLTKKFGDFTAVDAVDFDVATGESFGFLGPNGAGKTSTMRMIGCVSPITSGVLGGHHAASWLSVVTAGAFWALPSVQYRTRRGVISMSARSKKSGSATRAVRK